MNALNEILPAICLLDRVATILANIGIEYKINIVQQCSNLNRIGLK